MRGEKESRGVYIPGPLMVKYYGERANDGGLQITEATDICLDASAYGGTPGVFTATQLAGWRKVTDAVHAKGGFIFCQLWYTGRASSGSQRGGKQPISSSSIPMSGKYGDGVDCAEQPPRPMTVQEIHDLTAEWASAAKRAVDDAGFDGVEIHGKKIPHHHYHRRIWRKKVNMCDQVQTDTCLSNSSTIILTTELMSTAAPWKIDADSLLRLFRLSVVPSAQRGLAFAFRRITTTRIRGTAIQTSTGTTSAIA